MRVATLIRMSRYRTGPRQRRALIILSFCLAATLIAVSALLVGAATSPDPESERWANGPAAGKLADPPG